MSGEAPAPSSAPSPALSVVLIARHPGQRPEPALAALAAEPGIGAAEVILADGRPGAAPPSGPLPPRLSVLAAPGLAMPRLKALGAEAARGEAVAFLEPKGVPEPGWLGAALAGVAAHPGAALGGAVLPPRGAGPADGAAFVFEYGAFAPADLAAGRCRDLPGNNMVLPRRALLALCGEVLRTEGLNKPFVQARLLGGGVALAMLPRMAVRMAPGHRLGPLLRSRFGYARCYGGTRAALAPDRRWAYRLGAPLVPALLLARHLGAAGRVDLGARSPGLRPALALLCLAWSAGEALGSWAGPGSACDALY